MLVRFNFVSSYLKKERVKMSGKNWIFEVPTNHGNVSIAVHPGPHTDELLAIMMIQKAATRQFVMDHQAETIGLGVEGGPYDEHPNNGKPRKVGECTATLVGKALGIHQDPVWERMLRFAYWVDQGEPMPRVDDGEGSFPEEWNHPFDINNLFKCHWRRLSKGKKEVPVEKGLEYVTWALEILDNFWAQQRDFIAAEEEIRKNSETRTMMHKGRPLDVMLIRSDNPEINAAARYFFRAGLVIIRHSLGHVRIFRNKQNGVGLDDLMKLITIRECELRGEPYTGRWDELKNEGEGPGGIWYYFRQHGMLLNGSEQHEKPSTVINDDELLRLVATALDTDLFHPPLEDTCKKGSCRHSRTTPCPLYQYGLGRCQKERYDEARNRISG